MEFLRRRRDFITLLGGVAATWPLAARAQQSERTRHVAILMSGAEGDAETQARLAGIRQGLSRFGWSEGRNVEIDYRYASASPEQARLLARDLVALKPEVIVAPSVVVATALQRETRVIPIVFVGAIDPVGAGLVASLARPGGNLTGTLLNEEGIVGKWLAMLKEMAPQLARVAILFNPKMDEFEFAAYRLTAEADAHSLGMQLVPSPGENASPKLSAASLLLRRRRTAGCSSPLGLQPYCIATSSSNWPPDIGCQPSTKPSSGSQLGG
jgi:putative tryptophan/tyrosine transport system substrate-binding protein